MSDITLLRKLTEKSTLKFGQYHDVPIYNLLDLNRNTYLRWVYYNSSNITFMDNILMKIGILENEFINKPGKTPELYDIVTERIRKNMTVKSKSRLEKIKRISVEIKTRQDNKKDNTIHSLSNLARKNHGH